jgi:outer membrane scaffolding protein for murein synthesis (MipA/OmpV family)
MSTTLEVTLKFLLIPLLCACTSAYGQSATTQMPDGTTDIDLSQIAAIVPRAEGQPASRFIVLPTVSAQWSNGIYAAPGEVGMRLSRNPRWNVGPLLTYGTKPERADGRGSHNRWGVETGGFVSYRLAHNLQLSSQLLYGGGNDNRGVRVTAHASYGIELSAHQSFGFRAGFTAANASYMDSYFGVPPARPGLPPRYQAGGGLKNVFATASWNVELSTKYSVTTGLSVSRLAKSASDSPLVASPNNGSLFTQLTYHF